MTAIPSPSTALRILVIRRDNIGDLVCTTPLLHALRMHFPNAKICALVNSYNVAVLENNPDIDGVYAYPKGKHRPPGMSLARAYWDRMLLLLHLRSLRFDYAILAGSPASVPRALKLARMIGPKHVVAFADSGDKQPIDRAISYNRDDDTHEVEDVFRLAAPFGIDGVPPPLKICPDPAAVAVARKKLSTGHEKRLIGVHISARKPSQRWPSGHFSSLISELARDGKTAFLLFWSPGDEDNPHHPGDDRKAAEIMKGVAGLPVTAFPTTQLQELITGLSLCDAIICSDGGAMHLAAGLGKPILCFFGKSNSAHWRPWGVPYVLLQTASKEVRDIGPEEAKAGFEELMKKVG